MGAIICRHIDIKVSAFYAGQRYCCQRGSLVRANAIALMVILATVACSASEDNAYSALQQCDHTSANSKAAAAEDVWIPSQMVTLGSDVHPEEGPRVNVRIPGFWIDPHETTNADFERFVDATGYLTTAERDNAGGAVFDNGQWRLDATATWRNPFGAAGPPAQPDHPVVQVTYEDAIAYAGWRERDLPTEAEWEAAARGGIAHAEYTWGSSPRLEDGRPGANHWQGVFPILNTDEDGFLTLAPVGCFPANPYGLYDMAGNVWELTKDAWSLRPGADKSAAAAVNQSATIGSNTIKGGSWLCADNFCRNYRPAARQPADPSLGTSHIGFRTVKRAPNNPNTGSGDQ